MNRLNYILAIVLVVQLALLGVTALLPGESGEVETGGALLEAFDAGTVIGITIEDTDGETLVIAKNDAGDWSLPDADGYPVQATKVTEMLDKLEALEKTRPVAVNPSSHKRLKVSADDFERKLTLKRGEGDDLLIYMGTSAGTNASHMRLEDAPEVYLTRGLASWEVATAMGSWVDTLYFTAVQDNIVSFTLENANGVFAFEKADDAWTFDGLEAGEIFEQAGLDTMLGRAASVRMSAPLGAEAQEAYGMDAPQATITFTVRKAVETDESDETSEDEEVGEDASADAEDAEVEYTETTYTLMVGAKQDDPEGYVFKASDSEYYVLVSAYTGDSFVNATRDDFVTVPTEEPAEDPMEGPPEGPSDGE